ncbi:hypothetical protein GCM10018793_22570 [Streptomyces sulfonofaciens]|uniref:Secreted protein n=1 Tax=Streptomyces sulfonofaciens TaxID=68272 RepID=A0A919KXS4_9ACTN|nr:hypothetical protein [Streptomyces sulfonofaciens]GHH76573.1 hypothetical protein GCM10018793_22570 [Streptomyces sulfonofaciens]
MAARRRRITTAVVAAVAGMAFTVPALVGCDAVGKAMDCLHTADSIADSVTDLQQAVENASDDPTQADDALDAIEKNLAKIGDRTGDGDVDKAVDDLRKAVGNVRTAIRDGDGAPDLSPVTDAAGELTKVCTP